LQSQIGAWRSWLAYLHGVQGVGSSSLLAPTKLRDMKRISILLFVLFTALSFSVQAQSKGNRKLSIQKTIDNIINTVQNVDVSQNELAGTIGIYQQLAPYILYIGKDDERSHRSQARYETEEDKKIVDKIGKQLVSIANLSSDYSFGNFYFHNTPEGKWHIIEYLFDKKEDAYTQKVEFAFIKVKSLYLLGLIEKKE